MVDLIDSGALPGAEAASSSERNLIFISEAGKPWVVTALTQCSDVPSGIE
jgi:hypothetical protein